MVFVAISTVFRALTNIGSTNLGSTVYFDAATFGAKGLAMPYASSPGATSTATSYMNAISNDYGFHTSPVNVASADAMAEYLNSHFDGQAGAFFFDQLTSSTYLYNTSYPNSIPSIVNMVHNIEARDALNTKPDAHISSRFDAYPPSQDIVHLGVYLANTLIGFYIALGFNTIPALQAANVVKERETKAKRQQLIMGSSISAYWLSTWLWDLLQFIIPFAGAVTLVGVIGSESMRGANFPAIMLLVLLWGVAIPPLTYVFSFMFNKHQNAQTGILVIYSLATVVFFFTSFLLEFPTISIPKTVGEVLRYFFMLLPHYSLAKGMSDVGISAIPSVLTGNRPSAFEWNLAGESLAALFC